MKQQVSDEEILSAAMTLLSVEASRAQAIAAVLLAAAQSPTTGSAPALFPSAGGPSTTPAIVATAASVSGATDTTNR
ncbi:hypothetical protein ONZ45_g15532 [Pleurotus djamor]|nr:hypothetical protein ONZ45_g15532 [Pleurotus djamor]